MGMVSILIVMSEMYTEEQVMDAVRAGTGEIHGSDSMATNIILGAVAMKLVKGNVVANDSTPETADYSRAPDYTSRAIAAQSSQEIGELIVEGTDRLSKSIARYERPLDFETDHPLPHHVFKPTLFAEGSTVAENPVGRLMISCEDPSATDWSQQNIVAWLHLEGGEEAPCDPLERSETTLAQTLNVVRTKIRDPIAGIDRDAYYLEVIARYTGGHSNFNDGVMHEAKYGKPIGAAGAIVKANVFWALDTAITYYENIYIAGNKHPGLSYSDYRDAGCLDDNLMLDWHKGEAYVRSRVDETDEKSGGWPKLKDHTRNVLTMDKVQRENVERYKASIRAGMNSEARLATTVT